MLVCLLHIVSMVDTYALSYLPQTRLSQDPWHPLTSNHPTCVILGVCQVGQTPLEAYVGIKQAYLGSVGWELMAGHTRLLLVQTYIRCKGHLSPQFSQFPAILLNFHPYSMPIFGGKKGFFPLWPGNTQPGYIGKKSVWWSKILLVATTVDPTRVGGGQLSLPGVSWYKPTYDVMGPEPTHIIRSVSSSSICRYLHYFEMSVKLGTYLSS